MNKSEALTVLLEDLTWNNYIEISDAVTKFQGYEIDAEMTKQASVYSYYQGMLSLAKKGLDEAKLKLTQYCAITSKERQELSVSKITAANLTNFVESTESFRHYNKEVIEAEFKYTLLKGLVSALEHKKDMLIQVSSNRRSETNLYK